MFWEAIDWLIDSNENICKTATANAV